MLALLVQETTDSSTSSGAAVGIIVVAVVLYVAVAVIVIASMWRLFNKSGQKGWTAIVPILNTLVLLKVVHKELWWIILLFIPCVNIVVLVIVYFGLAEAFGKGAGWGIGILLLPFIFMPALAFGSSQYQLVPDPLL
jgi:hypothetical protein